MNARLKRFLTNFIVSVCSVLIFIAVAETVSRVKYEPKEIDYPWIFEYDKDKIIRLKSNIRDGEFAGKRVTTNSFGYRDTEIPIEKGDDVVRILVVGDSVSFGHGVDGDETYPQVLEKMLNQRITDYKFDVINTGVPGNSPFQEYHDLRRGMVFEPDIVIIQFVLNDLVEPYKAFSRYGGRGIDYHQVEEIAYWHYLLSQKSAFYLFLRDMTLRLRFGARTSEEMKKKAKQWAMDLDWNAAADEPDDEKLKEAWQECLKWMKREIDLSRRKGVKVILLISPVDFQLREKSRIYAQKRLSKFATENRVPYIDMLPYLESIVRKEVSRRLSMNEEFVVGEVDPLLSEALQLEEVVSSEVWNRYFLDYDHYSAKGHAFVAELLYPIVLDHLGKKMPDPVLGRVH